FDLVPDAVDAAEKRGTRGDDVRFARQAVGATEPEADVVGEELRQRIGVTLIHGNEQGPDEFFERVVYGGHRVFFLRIVWWESVRSGRSRRVAVANRRGGHAAAVFVDAPGRPIEGGAQNPTDHLDLTVIPRGVQQGVADRKTEAL